MRKEGVIYTAGLARLSGEIMRFVLAALIAAALASADANACSCIQQSREESFRGADLVFDGVIERIDVAAGSWDVDYTDELSDRDLAAAASELIGRAATFRVEREIKGVGETMRVVHYDIEIGGNCGKSFETGKRYRVFAYGSAGRWTTSSCTFTTELLLAAKDRNYRAVTEAEAFAKANPNDPVARWRPDRIRSEIDDEYFYQSYLMRVGVADDDGLAAIGRAFAVAFENEDFDRANAISEKAVERFGGDADAHMMQAKTLREREKVTEALTAAERALSLDPDDLDARDEAERLRFIVKGEATPGRRDYRGLFARKLDARNCVAPRADFSDGAFGEADFAGATLDGARFRRVVATKIFFDKARLKNARFDEAGGYRNELAWRKRVNGFSASFAGADLRGAAFAGANVSGADFTNADLRGADFSKASLEDMTFDGAKLDGARFAGAEFYRTRMDGADVGGADFAGAEAVNISWRGVDLRRAGLEGADVRGGVIDCGTRLPRGFNLGGTGLIPELAFCGNKAQIRDFSSVKWPYFLRLQKFDLGGANFSKGEFKDADFRGAQLKGADFSRSSGSAAFAGANLTGASFRDATIRPRFAAPKDEKSEFGDTVLEETDFSGAELEAEYFLSGGDDEPAFSPDISTAKFDGAKLSCNADGYEFDIETYDDFVADGDADAGFGLSDPAFLKQERDRALKGLAAEGALVRYLAVRWPTMVFDEACRSYLDEAE